MKQESIKSALNSVEVESLEVMHISDIVTSAEFGEAVDILHFANNIYTSGSGGTGIAARKFAHSLCCIGRNGFFMLPSEGIHGGMGSVNPGDAMVLVSKGGKTAELLPLAEVCKKKDAQLIVVTQNPYSPLADLADVIIPIDVRRESDKYDIMATSSVVALIALFDAMQVALMEETDFQLEEFELIHPGGAVGEQLSKK